MLKIIEDILEDVKKNKTTWFWLRWPLKGIAYIILGLGNKTINYRIVIDF